MARRGRYAFNAGAIAVTLSDGVDAAIADIVADAERIATDLVHKYGDEIIDRAKPKWPVKTGLSKKHLRARNLHLETTLLNDATKREKRRGRIQNVEYAYAINKGVTWQTLVLEPAEAGQPKLAEDIAEAIARKFGR